MSTGRLTPHNFWVGTAIPAPSNHLISRSSSLFALTFSAPLFNTKNNSKDLFGGEDVEVVPTSTVGFRDRMVHPGTIDILVKLASVTIKCHQSFDIYPKSLIGETEPLIQFHTTTTESISLREVRADEDNGSGKDRATPDDRTSIDGEDADEQQHSLMVIKEQQTDRTGWRVISIRPAMYEKIETWKTPS